MIASSQYKQMLTITYGNHTDEKTLSHNRTNTMPDDFSGIFLTCVPITMARPRQEEDRVVAQAPVGIDNQLQFTANLCTAHITSTGITGV